MAVADPPGPGAEVAEAARQLRDACRERSSGVLEIQELKSRLVGETTGATLEEIDRIGDGALVEYQAGRYEHAIRALRAVIADLEKLPESSEIHERWIKALLLLAHAEETLGHSHLARAAMERVVAVEPHYQPDPEQYSPTYRRTFESVRARVAARPRRKLTVTSLGAPATVYLDGRAWGTTPVTVVLPAGRYHLGAARGSVRVPSTWVDLRAEDQSLMLDLSLAESLRMNGGPGLALDGSSRPNGIVRAGVRLEVQQVLAVSVVVERQVQLLVGSLYDIDRGALVREGRVRMSAGAIPTQHLGSLATFLLTGRQVEGVETSTPPPAGAIADASIGSPGGGGADSAAEPQTASVPGPSSLNATPPARLGIQPRPWMRPTAYVTGAAAILLVGFATYQGISAHGAYQEAHGMLRPDGSFTPGVNQTVYSSKLDDAASASQRAYLAAGGALVMAAVAGMLWYVTGEPQSGTPAVRF